MQPSARAVLMVTITALTVAGVVAVVLAPNSGSQKPFLAVDPFARETETEVSRKPYLKMDYKEGIERGVDIVNGGIKTGQWNKVIDGRWVVVTAGATLRHRMDVDRPTWGSAGVLLWDQTEGETKWYFPPGKPRPPLRIVRARQNVLTLKSPDGTVLRFDAVKRRYLPV